MHHTMHALDAPGLEARTERVRMDHGEKSEFQWKPVPQKEADHRVTVQPFGSTSRGNKGHPSHSRNG